MSTEEQAAVVRRWVRPVKAAQHRSGLATLALADASELAALPVVGPIITYLALAAGAVLAISQPGYDHVFTQSIIALGIIMMAGALGARVGLFFFLGFVLTDFLLVPYAEARRNGFLWLDSTVIDHFVQVIIPRLPTYLALWLITVQLPLLLASIVPILISRFTPDAALLMLWTARSIVAYVAVLIWGQITAILVRPIFVWRDALHPPDAFIIVQERGHTLARVFVAVLLARAFWQFLCPRLRSPSAIAREVWEALATLPPATPRLGSLNDWWKIAGRAAVVTMFVMGLVSTLLECAAIASIFFSLEALRRGKLVRPDAWPRAVLRIPVPVRMLIVATVALLTGLFAISADVIAADAGSLRPIAVVLVATFAAVAVLYPTARITQEAGRSSA